MSVISTKNKSNKTNKSSKKEEDNSSEFDGLWLNIGKTITNPETNESEFIRLQLGVPVSSLKTRKIYSTMSPEFAKQIRLENLMIEQIHKMGVSQEEGESTLLTGLEIQLYKRNEAVDDSSNTEEEDTLDFSIL